MNSVIIHDEYRQPWRIQEDDQLYEEAKAALEATRADENAPNDSDQKVVWPLKKIVEGRGFGWWTVFQQLDEFERELGEAVPNPGTGRLIDIDREYNPTELQDILQRFGSYLATLNVAVAKIEAQTHALKESYKTGMQVAVASRDPKATLSARESEVLSAQELFRETRRLQISNEAILLLAKGWLASYEAAFQTVSRLITLRLGEASLATGRHI